MDETASADARLYTQVLHGCAVLGLGSGLLTISLALTLSLA